MSEAEQLDDANASALPEEGSEAWRDSMVGIMRNVLMRLPDDTSLGQIVAAATANPTLAPALRVLSVRDLIEIAVTRPVRGNADGAAGEEFDPEGAGFGGFGSGEAAGEAESDELGEFDEGGLAVIRRRADIPD